MRHGPTAAVFGAAVHISSFLDKKSHLRYNYAK